MQNHKYANLFPMMSDAELKSLIEDMRENGYDTSSPIVTYQGFILDGRNRYIASAEAGVKPAFVEYDGDNPLEFVLRHNLHRRHLNETQRAGVAAKLANLRPSERISSANLQSWSQVSVPQAAEMLNVGARTVATYRAVAAAMPELVEKMDSGEMTAHEAQKKVNAKCARPDVKQSKNLSNTINLYSGDMVNVLSSINTKYDLVVADPPYNVTEWKWDKFKTPKEFLDTTETWLNAIVSHLNDKYCLFWFCSPSYAADIEILLRELELPIQSRLVWHRRNMAKGSDAKYKFIDSWEMIFHCGNKELNFPSNWDASRFDVQTFAVPQTNFTDTKYHPTQKPEELIKWLVEYGSFMGDRILDPFGGSGTTGAVSFGRDCDLIEVGDEYLSVIERRLNVKRL